MESPKRYTQLTDVTAEEARLFLLKSENYASFQLPYYVSFDGVIKVSEAILKNKDIKSLCNGNSPGYFSDVNYTIMANKGGEFSWRTLQLIHPVLYVDLVNIITEPKNWREIQDFFNRRKETKVECASMPLVSNTSESDRAEQVTSWWEEVEQKTLALSLEYNFMYQTDILDCYSSIYTHSFEWALDKGGRLGVKKARSCKNKKEYKMKSLGQKIDHRLMNMHYRQTNGIPQGSTLMDFLAEIVLGGVDMELNSTMLEDEDLKGRWNDFTIIRYRDDYRILSVDGYIGHKVMKTLSDVLTNWGFKMNSGKTSQTNNIVLSAAKQEKNDEIFRAPCELSFQKEAMRIFLLFQEYPSSGLIAKKLISYYDILNAKDEIRKITSVVECRAIISIITMVAYNNPKYIAQAAGIIGKLISEGNIERHKTIEAIINKFSGKPNTDFVDIWLQRIMDGEKAINYSNSKISEVISGKCESGELWNSSWLPGEYQRRLNVKISTLKEKIDSKEYRPKIKREEIQLYINY